MKPVQSGRQVTPFIVMERGGLANAAPNDWQECHLEQCRDPPQQRHPSSLEVARHCGKKKLLLSHTVMALRL